MVRAAQLLVGSDSEMPHKRLVQIASTEISLVRNHQSTEAESAEENSFTLGVYGVGVGALLSMRWSGPKQLQECGWKNLPAHWNA